MHNMVARLLVAVALLWSGTLGVSAQYASRNISGTIAVTNTFQLVLAQDVNRKGCTLQNTGSNTMYFLVMTAADATTAGIAKAGKLAAGQGIGCDVLYGPVSITGTAADTYYLQTW